MYSTRSHRSCTRRPAHVTTILIFAIIFAIAANMITAQEYLPPKNGGGKKVTEEPTMPANYEFSYEVQDPNVNLDFGHNEKRMNDLATGSFHVLLPDGRMQLVEYEAGPNGYKPQVTYMGTATFPESDKFEGYNYNAASSPKEVRRAAPTQSSIVENNNDS